jgi:hypothetical protein
MCVNGPDPDLLTTCRPGRRARALSVDRGVTISTTCTAPSPGTGRVRARISSRLAGPCGRLPEARRPGADIIVGASPGRRAVNLPRGSSKSGSGYRAGLSSGRSRKMLSLRETEGPNPPPSRAEPAVPWDFALRHRGPDFSRLRSGAAVRLAVRHPGGLRRVTDRLKHRRKS